MFKIKNQVMNHRQFFVALNSINSMALPTKVAWNIKKLIKELQKAEETVREAVKEIGKECFKHDEETGVWVPLKGGDGTPIPGKYEEAIKDGSKIFEEKTEEILNLEIELKSPKINIHDLENISLAPAHLEVIEDLIDEDATRASLKLV